MLFSKRKFNSADISASEYAAFALVGIFLAVGLAFNNGDIELPRLLYILPWIVGFIFLIFAIARVISGMLTSANLPLLSFALLLVFGVCFFALKSTSTGFIRHDEIYSWGMWGVQHFLGQPYDTYYTQAPYPQLFAYELGSVFLAQGNHVSHFAAKLVCGIPALVIVIAFSDLVARSSSQLINWLTLLLTFGALASFGNLLFWAYADPLATALILLSFTLLLQYSEKPAKLRPLMLSLFCGLLASLTKQPGLVWCLATLPMLIIYGVWRWKWRPAALAACIVVMLLAAIWPLFVAPEFTGNQGVLDIVKKNGGWMASVMVSLKKYIVYSPNIGMLLIGTMLVSLFSGRGRVFWILCVLPFLVIWFTVGAYEQRHGTHVLFVSTALANYLLIQRCPCIDGISREPRIFNFQERIPTDMICVAVSVVLLTSSVYLAYQRNYSNLQDGNKAIFISQFGDESNDLYRDIIDNQRRIFVVSNYQYGMFFNRTVIGRPELHRSVLTPKEFLEELANFKPEYIIDAGEWTYGPYSSHLREMIEVCPDAFSLRKKNDFSPYSAIYQVDSQALGTECSSRFDSAPL